MASWITSSKVNFEPDSSHTATGWIAVYQDSSTTSNASVTITGHINLYSTKDPASWYGTFSSSSTNITSNKGTVTKSLPNKSFTTNRSTKYHNEQIGTFTITIPRGTVAQTATISVSSSITITSSDFSGKSASGTVTGSATVSVPVLQSYAVTYNNNNGTGTTQSQTKYYDVALSLNYTNPSLTDYSFIGWATSEANAKAGTYSGTYVKGYSYTSNAALTLYGTYALTYSKPIINNLSVERCSPDPDNVGQYLPDDEGTYAIVSFDWSVFTSNSPQYYGGSTYPYSSNAVDSCTVTVGSETATPTLSGTSGSETVVVGSGNFSTDTQYATTVEITDTQTATSPHTTTAGGALPTSSFPIDVNADGTAVAILRPAPDNDSGLFVGGDAQVSGNFEALGDGVAFGTTATDGEFKIYNTLKPLLSGSMNLGVGTTWSAAVEDAPYGRNNVAFGIDNSGNSKGIWCSAYNGTAGHWLIREDENGVTYIPSESIRLKGHSSNIGTTKNAYLSAATSVSSGGSNAKSLCQLSLEAGTWIIIYGARFPTNTTGNRTVNMSTTKNDQSAMQVVAPASGGVTQTRAALVVSPSSTVIYYLTVAHTATSALTMPASGVGYGTFMTAVRLM